MKTSKQKKFVVRARCGAETKTLLQCAASTLGLDESDIIRLAIKQYAASIIAQPTPIPHGK